MKQTAVEWFFNELEKMQYFIGNDMLEAYKQAKEKEKKDICYFGAKCCFKTTEKKSWTLEELYDETFKK
jgi:hypothetical protein